MKPHALLMAKLTLVLLLSDGLLTHLGRPIAPFLPQLSTFHFASWMGLALKALFLIAGASLVFNRWVRLASVLLGLITAYALLASTAAYGAHVALAAGLLLLAPLHAPGSQPWLVRLLVTLALTLSALTMALDPAWRNGDLVAAWINTGSAHPVFVWIRGQLMQPWIYAVIAWLIMALRFVVAIALLVPRTQRVATWVLAGYLVIGGLILASPEMNAFSIMIGIGSLSFLQWPDGAISVLWPRACGFPLWLRIALDRYDWDQRLDWPLPPDPDAILEVEIGRHKYEDSRALSALLMHFPSFLMAAFAWLWCAHLLLPTWIAIVVQAVFIIPILILFVLRRLKQVGRRIRPAAQSAHD